MSAGGCHLHQGVLSSEADTDVCVQDVQLKTLTGVDHNTELAQKAQRRLESLAAEQTQQGAAQHNSQTPAPEPAKPAASVLLADIVAGAETTSALQDTCAMKTSQVPLQMNSSTMLFVLQCET